MLTLLSSLLAGAAWVGTHLWVLFLAVVPSITSFLSPVLSAIVDGFKQLLSTIWTGLSQITFPIAVVITAIATATFLTGYHFGWVACLDWIHSHFRLVSKVPVSNWWKFW